MWGWWGKQKVCTGVRWRRILNNSIGNRIVGRQNWTDAGYCPARIFVVIHVSVVIDAFQYRQKLLYLSLTNILCCVADRHVTSCGLEASDVATRLRGYDFSRMFSAKTYCTSATNEGVWRLCVPSTKRGNWNTEVSLSRQLVERSAAEKLLGGSSMMKDGVIVTQYELSLL